MQRKIKLLIIDDSALVRQSLQEIFSHDEEIEVMATAHDPIIAIEKMKKQMPDVIMLDIEMPRMDGLTFLKKLMHANPIPVVICSGVTGDNPEIVMKAMEYGAVERITKPKLGKKQFLEESRIHITDKVKAAYHAKLDKLAFSSSIVSPKLTADVVLAKPKHSDMIETTEKIVVVGASTGGTEALQIFLEALPFDAPGIVIVQHMPEHFTQVFAKRINTLCTVTVKEAENNDSIIPGQALIAPGNKHILVKRSGSRYYVEVRDGPLVKRHRPSVDVLFRSTARYAGKNAIGIIMTGMGDDGAQGMKEMYDSGALTFAQDEKSCVVFGMPGEAIRNGGVCHIVPLQGLSENVIKAVKKKITY